MRAWFPTRIEIDRWEPGATLTHHFDGQPFPPLPGKVLECSEPHRLVFTWGDDTIGFELSAAEGGTVFVLTEELAAPHAARNAAGWEVCLERLVDGAVGEDWAPRSSATAPPSSPHSAPQERPPADVDKSSNLGARSLRDHPGRVRRPADPGSNAAW